MLDTDITALAQKALERCRRDGIMAATAESCTGGLVAAALTAISGSSDVVDRGFVTYSNAAKMAMLGVPETILSAHGAVSEATARAMAEGALARSEAGVAVSITGIAGPGGGSAEKPVGLVWFALARSCEVTRAVERRFPASAGRDGIRKLAVIEALDLLASR
jgi:nicotinamide-nucleotide amidase